MKINDNLSIKAMTINQIYSLYREKRLIVNRRYQRKLCWTIEEKRNFIDSLINGYPVPLFLLAMDKNGNYEIIDGMQRLEAICSLIDQKYELLDGYFNLESMPDTLSMLRSGLISQKKDMMILEKCKEIANYPLPVSVFSATDNNIEEVFKRINSTGKHLSLQELRQVGVNTDYANLIRLISSEIRGDSSKDILCLNDMSNISLSNYRLPYMISVDDTFWIKNEMFTRNDLRMSRDEEVIGFILAYIITGKYVYSGNLLNKYYGYLRNPLSTEVPVEVTSVQQGIDRVGTERIRTEFELTMSCMMDLLGYSKMSFRDLVNASKEISDISLQFQIVFFAMHRLLIKEGKTKYNACEIFNKLYGHCSEILGVKNKMKYNIESKVDMVYGLIERAFEKGGKEDPALDDWTMKCINILNRSRTEQVLYDFKIGFVEYNKTSLEENTIGKVLKTLTAINNVGPGKVGYVIIGVAENEEDAKKYAKMYNEKYSMEGGFAIIGIEHDSKAISMSLDRYTHTIKEHIRHSTCLTDEYKQHILTNIKTPLLYDHQLIMFKTEFNKPVTFDSEYYIREFTDVRKLSKDELPILFESYYK